MCISQSCTGWVEQLIAREKWQIKICSSSVGRKRNKKNKRETVISDCHAGCSSLAGKQHFLSDRQLREITETIWSGGSFITAYPSARPGLLLLILLILRLFLLPSSLFPLFTKAPQRIDAPWLWILNAVRRWALLSAFLSPYLFRALVIWVDVRGVNAIGF